MDSAARERLRLVIAVAIALLPQAVRKAFADRYDPKQQEAGRELSGAAADAVLQAYDVAEKPRHELGAGAQYRGPGGR